MLNTTEFYCRSTLIKLSVLLWCLLCVQNSYAQDEHNAESDVVSTASSDYSLGMQAYLNGDFEKAQIHWLNAVKQNHARSMFNLGFLHEQAKISGADIEKAENWYRLAGKHGYAAADFHLAQLKITSTPSTQENAEDVQALLRRSADNGFAPAIAMLNQSSNETTTSNLNDDMNPQTGLSPEIINKDSKDKGNLYLTEQWIAQKKPSNWTIQILAFEEKEKVHQFIDLHQLNATASYFAESTQDKVLYKLIYGSYQTKQEAERARDNLSNELKQHGPWLRTIASVQAQLD